MAGPLWRATIENTSVPGGPLALQVRPLLSSDVVEVYPYQLGDDPRVGGRPKVVNWRTNIIGILEAEVAPTDPGRGPGFLSRPVVGRVTPPWVETRAANLTPLSPTCYRSNARITSGRTPGGTSVGGPIFSAQSSLPAAGGASHKTFYSKVSYPADAPLLIFGYGTHSFETDGPEIPAPAAVLYCRSGVSPGTPITPGGRRVPTNTGVVLPQTPQTYYGSIVFEEL